MPSYRAPSNKSCLFICSAQEVYDLVSGPSKKRIESSDLLKLSIPLQCLFCHFSVTNNFSDGFPGLFHFFFLPPLASDRAEPEEQRGYEDEVPSIIIDLLEAREHAGDTQIGDSTRDIQDVLSQYQHEFIGTNGVAIVRIE